MRRGLVVALLLLCSSCSRLPPLTSDRLTDAAAKWKTQQPNAYHLVIEISGDRVEAGHFDVNVTRGQVISLRRNGLVIPASRGQDYSMEGLFHMLEQELSLAGKPATLGAPDGYSLYLNAGFDDMTGRLIRYRRIVGGTSNSIDIRVVTFEAQ